MLTTDSDQAMTCLVNYGFRQQVLQGSRDWNIVSGGPRHADTALGILNDTETVSILYFL